MWNVIWFRSPSFALRQLLRRAGEEVADLVIEVASLLRHRTSTEIVDRRFLQPHEHLAFLLEVRLDVGEQSANLLVGDLRNRRAKLQRARPRDAGHLEQQSDLALVGALEHRRLRVEAENLRDPPKVSLEDLTDVHSRRHAERVEHDVDRTAVGEERHVLLGDDASNDTLVAVTSGHLVADRDLTLLGQIHLHELDHARRQFVGLEDAVDALFRLLLDLRLLVVRRVDDLTHALVDALVLDAQRLEVDRRELHFAQRLGGHLGPAGMASSTVPLFSASAMT